jgi:hypothetical protein
VSLLSKYGLFALSKIRNLSPSLSRCFPNAKRLDIILKVFFKFEIFFIFDPDKIAVEQRYGYPILATCNVRNSPVRGISKPIRIEFLRMREN